MEVLVSLVIAIIVILIGVGVTGWMIEQTIVLARNAIIMKISLFEEHMNNQEQELNNKIADLATAVGTGFSELNSSVGNAVDRITRRLDEREIDLSDETAALAALKDSVQSGSTDTINRINAILPDTVEPIPVPEPLPEVPDGGDATDTSAPVDTGTPTAEVPSAETESTPVEENPFGLDEEEDVDDFSDLEEDSSTIDTDTTE